MSRIYLPWNASKARVREAEHARKNRAEIVRELSWGRVSRRDLLKWGLFTGGGLLAPIGGLNPFVKSAYAREGTGVPLSPLFGVRPFTQPMPRFDVLRRNAPSCLTPAPTAEANETLQPSIRCSAAASAPSKAGRRGRSGRTSASTSIRRRSPSKRSQAPAATNYVYNPEVVSSLNSGIDPAHGMPLRFHRGLPIQDPNAVWTFNGTIPPKLVQARYGEPILFRHHNRLPADVTQNGGFGRHTISTHEHNGHHGAENDGFTGAFFFPNQFYDYHWPIVLAGHFSVNTGATDRMASSPDGNGGLDATSPATGTRR